jgi:hypothetical protein
MRAAAPPFSGSSRRLAVSPLPSGRGGASRWFQLSRGRIKIL